MGHRDEITDADFLAVLPKAESEARYWARRAHLSPEDTEDLVQTALIEVIKGRERFDPLKSSWETYAVNCAKWGAQREITETAKKRKRRGITIQRMEGPEIDPRAAEPVISAEAEEIKAIILEVLETRPKESNFYQCGILIFFEGFNQTEAAKELGISTTRAQQIAESIRNEVRRKTADPDD